MRNEKVNRFYAHILTGDDAKVGDIGVHVLLDDGGIPVIHCPIQNQNWESFG